MSKFLKNPLLEDIVVNYDKHGENPQTFTILAGEIKEIEEPYIDHVKSKIYNAIINYRKLNGIALNANPKAKKKILDEIESDI